MRFKRRFLLYAVLAGALAATTVARAGVFEKLDTAEEAYIYGFPMIAAYKAMYQFNIDKSSGQYKTGFNQTGMTPMSSRQRIRPSLHPTATHRIR
jgi:hypothetical protein